MTRILSVEDDPVLARLVQAIVENEGYAFEHARTGREFREALRKNPPALCLIDLGLPDVAGLDLLKQVRESLPEIPVIVLTASGEVEDVVAAMKAGATDYISKPVDPRRLAVSLRNALRLSSQEEKITRLRARVDLLGSSPAMEQVRGLLRRAAPNEATVLLVGESGTGKELAAHALHSTGRRVRGPFVDVNCAALTETLLESELFGHEAGAFTGASGRRRGKFEQAHGGTLFLDEIGDMPLSMQAKILRVLQERAFQRVGGEKRIGVDVRVVCATSRDLEEAVAQGAFRTDLFYRINTLVIEIPALRNRPADIPELARYFLAHANAKVRDLSAVALAALARHSWPGNVRELQHAIERALLVCDEEEIRPEHLPPAVLGAPVREHAPSGLVGAVEQLERTMIVEALQKSGWIKARAARALGITERIISYKMENFAIRPPSA